MQAGYVWINEVGKHFLGAPFGGIKQSGFGREECLGEMLSFTQEKNIHVGEEHSRAAAAKGCLTERSSGDRISASG